MSPVYLDWLQNIDDKQRIIVEKVLNLLPGFYEYQEQTASLYNSFDELLDNYEKNIKKSNDYSLSIAANLLFVKRKYENFYKNEIAVKKKEIPDLNSIATWNPLPAWAEKIKTEDLCYLNDIIIHIPYLSVFLFKNPTIADLNSLMSTFEVEYCPCINSDNALKFGINSVKRAYQRIKEKSIDALHYVSSSYKIDDAKLIKSFVRDAPRNFDNIDLANADISDFLSRYIHTYNPYIDSYIAGRLIKYAKVREAEIFYSHVCKHVFSFPNMYWHNSESVYGCACALNYIAFSKLNNLGNSNLNLDYIEVKRIYELCYLVSSRIIYWSDKNDSCKLTYDAHKLPIQASDKIKSYNVCYKLLDSCEDAFISNEISKLDIELIKYSILRNCHVMAYNNKLVGQNSMYTQKAIELFQTGKLYLDFNPDQAYEKGNILNDRLSHDLYNNYRQGVYIMSSARIGNLFNLKSDSHQESTISASITPYLYNNIVYKANRKEIADYLRANGITCFYHFTERGRLSSIIKEGGILSYRQCLEQGVVMPRTSDVAKTRDIDASYELDDYARLSFCRYLPKIAERKLAGKDLVLLRIDVEVAEFEDTRFSDIEATQEGFRHGPTLEDLKRVNIAAVKKTFCSDTDPLYWQYQAEVLIKGKLPLKYILNIDNPENL